MKEIDLHSALFVLEWMKKHSEICCFPLSEAAPEFFDTISEQRITTGELLDRIKNDYEQRNKQQGR